MGRGQASPTPSAWEAMPFLGVQILPGPAEGDLGGGVRFLAQQRGCDSCPRPLVRGHQLWPLKPEPRCPTAELGKETTPQPPASRCSMGCAGVGGVSLVGLAGGVMRTGGVMWALMASLPTAVDPQGMVPCWGVHPLPQSILSRMPSPVGVAGLVPPHPSWKMPLPATAEDHHAQDTQETPFHGWTSPSLAHMQHSG